MIIKKKKEYVIRKDICLPTVREKRGQGLPAAQVYPVFLKYRFGITDVTGIIKYGIRQLLIAGLNDHVIRKITGASDELIGGCIMQDEDEKMYKEINNKLVTVELYYDF